MDWSIYNNLKENSGKVPPQYVVRFSPYEFIPEDIQEQLKEFDKIDNIVYTTHSEERMRERDLVLFKRLDLNGMDPRDIDMRRSRHNNHKGILGKDFLPDIQKVEATYNPKTGTNEILRVSYRIKNVIERKSQNPQGSINKAEDKEIDSSSDVILVMQLKSGKKGKKLGVVVTGWMCNSDDFNYEHGQRFADQKHLNRVTNQISKDYRLSLTEVDRRPAVTNDIDFKANYNGRPRENKKEKKHKKPHPFKQRRGKTGGEKRRTGKLNVTDYR